MQKNSVAVIDSGGRGAALVEAYRRSKHVGTIYFIPGNDYTATIIPHVTTFPTLKTTDVTAIVAICKKNTISLVDVAQDNAIAVGLTNALRQKAIPTVGPSKEAGQIEWDKAWSREFMRRVHIPQPEFHIFNTATDGIAFLQKTPAKSVVIKAAGLAEGKGVGIAHTKEEAIAYITTLTRFGTAGQTFLIEEFLEGDAKKPGEEFSAFAICDGKNWQMIGYAQDHKKAFDGDKGENTGGMGCSTPPLVVNQEIDRQTKDIFDKIFAGLVAEERAYQGILYFGGMVIEKNGKPTVFAIECNARWGDPEAEVLVPGIVNDFYELHMAVAQGKLKGKIIKTDGKSRVSIVVAAKGYPEDYSAIKGKTISGLQKAAKIPGIKLYAAGMKRNSNDYVVTGGRILHVVGEGNNVFEAKTKAQNAREEISVEGNNDFSRSDIGYRDEKRLKNPTPNPTL